METNTQPRQFMHSTAPVMAKMSFADDHLAFVWTGRGHRFFRSCALAAGTINQATSP